LFPAAFVFQLCLKAPVVGHECRDSLQPEVTFAGRSLERQVAD
jgi:hypothetical protein